jgi:hypothetical protein
MRFIAVLRAFGVAIFDCGVSSGSVLVDRSENAAGPQRADSDVFQQSKQ